MGDIDKIIQGVSPVYKKKKGPSAQHQLIYDSMSEQLEPIYFWILDFMNGMFGGKVEKIIDNFASSAGSGHFGEMGQRKSLMQQQATQLLTSMNAVLKAIINLLYDLKDFQVRLKYYDQARSKDARVKEAGDLSLKQIWMDKVDALRGIGSINQLSSGQLNYVTLRDAFIKAKTLEDVSKIDLNERVISILKPRLQEYLTWKKASEMELRKRFEIEKTYLKSQVDSLKLQARWAKPYLKAAEQLETGGNLGSNAALVTAFNTIMLELTLMGKAGVNVEGAVIDKDLPKDFAKMKNLRSYNAVVFVDFNFRGMPSKSGQHYTFGGRSEVTFKAYALSNEELDLLKDKLGESDLMSSLKLIQGMTDDSISQLKIDLDEFLVDEDKEKEEDKSKDENPFSALFSFLKPSSKSKKKKDDKNNPKEKLKMLKEKGIKKDNYAEQYIRNLAEADAINRCYTIFDIYKKAHGMASLPYVDEAEGKVPQTEADKLFGFK